MNLEPGVLLKLRPLLEPIDRASSRLAELRSAIDPVQQAEARLRQQGETLNGRRSELTESRIAPDAARVAAIVAGKNVPQPKKDEIEARASELRSTEAQLRQVTDDLGAVRAHLGALRADISRESDMLANAELALLLAIGEAQIDAFKAETIAFVRDHVAPLYSLAVEIRKRSGKFPDWYHAVIQA